MRKLTEEEVKVLENLDGKVCKLCNNYKSRKEFEFSGYNKDKMKSYCQVCRVEYDRIKRIDRKSKDFFKYSTREKDRKLRLKYNINLADYLDLLDKQNYKCKICNKPHEEGKRTNLFVDHCHDTMKVRGLICNSCNKGLGDFKDSIELLESAIKYLKEE